MKKEKHGKSDKHSKMSRPDGKTVSVKKELVTPVKVCVCVCVGGRGLVWLCDCLRAQVFISVCVSVTCLIEEADDIRVRE